jgi:hypothetical protein
METSIKATKLNAVSTLISGLGIMLFGNKLAQIFEISTNVSFLVVGGVITVFSLTMFIEIKKQRALAILWIITQDFLFTMASIYVLIFKPFDISATGYLLIGLFLIPIIFFIIYQSIGLSKIDSKKGSTTKAMSFKRIAKANKFNCSLRLFLGAFVASYSLLRLTPRPSLKKTVQIDIEFLATLSVYIIVNFSCSGGYG